MRPLAEAAQGRIGLFDRHGQRGLVDSGCNTTRYRLDGRWTQN
jgi:hypothetical protein